VLPCAVLGATLDDPPLPTCSGVLFLSGPLNARGAKAVKRPECSPRPVPLFCAETFARIASERKWVIGVYLITAFIVLPLLVIIVVGVL